LTLRRGRISPWNPPGVTVQTERLQPADEHPLALGNPREMSWARFHPAETIALQFDVCVNLAAFLDGHIVRTSQPERVFPACPRWRACPPLSAAIGTTCLPAEGRRWKSRHLRTGAAAIRARQFGEDKTEAKCWRWPQPCRESVWHSSAAQQLQFLLNGQTITQVREDIRTVNVLARSAGPERLRISATVGHPAIQIQSRTLCLPDEPPWFKVLS
jgi:hypothetical protein